jgi:hypothetical protein
MNNHRFWLSLLGGISISLAVHSPGAFAQDAGGRDVVNLGGLRSRAPADWVQEQPDDRQSYRQYRLVPVGDSADPAQVSIRFLGNGNGGTATDYVKRWEGMFLPPEGRTMREAAKVRRLTLDGSLATYVDIRGDYRGIPGDVATPRQDFRLLGVYLDTPKGAYVIRLMGPDETVRFYRQGFDNWVKGFKQDNSDTVQQKESQP